MRRDFQSMEHICYLGKQELERAQAHQLKSVTRKNRSNLKASVSVQALILSISGSYIGSRETTAG
jgi:hypothetical protein